MDKRSFGTFSVCRMTIEAATVQASKKSGVGSPSESFANLLQKQQEKHNRQFYL